MKEVILKSGKEKPLLAKHHWIFSGALKFPLTCEPGSLLPVYSEQKHLLGWAYFNPKCSLIGRMVSFGNDDPHLTMEHNLIQAIQLRKSLFDSNTTAYRLVNGEGDLLPGLIIDRYDDILVLQIGTYGMEKLKSFILSLLKKHIPECTTIYEKSSLSCRKMEGLLVQNGYLCGSKREVTILENGIAFRIDVEEGQKTGFFLDQREMRVLVSRHAKGKKVLNCFSYSGGFSLFAASGGAHKVTSLDISAKAIELAKRNFELNRFPGHFVVEDVFDYLKSKEWDEDFVILDPPAFAKKREDLKKAESGYRELNRLTLEKLPPKSYLLTCSCSHHVDEELFQKIIFQAALMAKRNIKILSRHRLAEDHPINLYHPESDYLKSLFLFVE